jgi:hypothetical protein
MWKTANRGKAYLMLVGAGILTLAGGASVQAQGSGEPAFTSNGPIVFGFVPVGSASAPVPAVVSNSGEGRLDISGVAVKDTNPHPNDPHDFSISSDGCTGASLGAGQSCTVTVVFHPVAVGTRVGTLVFTDNRPSCVNYVTLAGSSTSAAAHATIADCVPVVTANPPVVAPSSGVKGEQVEQLGPKLAVRANLTPVSGSVFVKLPGSSTFVALTAAREIPFGTVVNATHGKVTVTTEGPHGGIQTMTFFEGEFELTQDRKGLVVATLTGGDFSVCPTRRERSHLARTSSKHASPDHAVRKLWAEGHGSYSTKGSYAGGAALGTRWLTEDLCDGTLIRVATDRVKVTNLVNHRHVTVTAGHSYLAKAP